VAGIGFVLRELDRRDTISGTLSAAGHGMIVAAGPWLFTVVSLVLIHRGTSAVLTSQASYNFRSYVMYAFAVSLLATAPFVNVSVRLAADDIYRRTYDGIRARLVAALCGSVLASAVISLAVYGLLFGIGGFDLLIAVGTTAVVAMIWPVLAFCGAVRDYRGITAGFAIGMLVSVLGTIWIARRGYGEGAMIGMFLLGLSIVFFALASRVFITFPVQSRPFGEYLMGLAGGFVRHWMLALGSLGAIGAIWADKWIMWFGPDALTLSNGLVSAPPYDSAMFLAYLLMIPALGLFVTAIETSFFEHARRFLDAIEDKAPLVRLERYAGDLEVQTYRIIYRVLLTLGPVCLVCMLLSPVIVPIVGLQYQQLGILRLGILAVFFQFMFVAASSIVLFLDRQLRFLALQLVFLSAQVGFTIMTIYLGREYFGYGHLLACALSAFLAMVVLERTLSKVVFLTFASALRRPPDRSVATAVRAKASAPRVEIWEETPPLMPIPQSGPLLRPRPKIGGMKP